MSRRPLPAEQPLDETSAAYRALFERNPLPMWLYDSETLAFLEVNDAAVAQYGYSRAEFLGMTILDLRPEEDRAALARETPSLGGVELQVWPAPWRHLRKDGSTCLVRVASHPLRFSGRPARLVVVQDVTETTQTADALRESREQYRFFIGRTAEGVWRAAVDPPMPVDAPESEQVDRIRHARLVEVNDAMVRMYGLASEEGLLGTLLASTFDLADPRSVDFFQTFVQSGYRTVELESHEFDRNGSPRWFVNNLLGVVEDGLLVAIWGTQRDVTEHRRREELVRATRDHLDALVQASPLPIVSLTMGGDVMSWNRAAETVFGWSAEEAVGRRLLCVPPEKQGEFDQVRNTALRSGGFTGYETVRVRRDGSRIDVSISTAPLRDAAGGPTGLVATYLDISDRKRAEEALRQSQEQMRQAQKMEAVGRLAGGVAHDFNNLLSAILELQRNGASRDLPEGHPSRDDAEQIRQAGDRAAELTHQLLAFSRRQLLQPRSLDLNTIVASVDRMLRRLIGEDIELRTVLDPALGHARGPMPGSWSRC